jgi:hypothetical protein
MNKSYARPRLEEWLTQNDADFKNQKKFPEREWKFRNVKRVQKGKKGRY